MFTFLYQFTEKHWHYITLCFLLLITIFSLTPVEQLPAMPGSDKTHHLTSYCLLMLPSALFSDKHRLKFALFFILYSGVIELIQPYVNRYGEWLDLLANSVGILCALIIAHVIKKLINKK